MPVAGGVNVHWYGHGFIYLTSSVGIRAAIDPFGSETVHYKFPEHLAADFVLVTHEAEDHCAADQIFGNPLIFRSVMAVGLEPRQRHSLLRRRAAKGSLRPGRCEYRVHAQL